MRRPQLNRYQRLLQTRRQELLHAIGTAREPLSIAPVSESMDRAIALSGRDLAAAGMERMTGDLRLVEAALHRIGASTFGLCVECGEPIGTRRLEAVPWAPYCLVCQQCMEGSGFPNAQAALHQQAASAIRPLTATSP